jgi:hypothetical protein
MTDKERLDWLERNASKLGISPDYRWGYVGKYARPKDMANEYTNIREKIDEAIEMSNHALTDDNKSV